jgi:polyisoprenoid-binding protein YceI
MTKLVSFTLALALGAATAACKNPADDKARAKVEEAKPEPGLASGSAAPAAATVKYDIAPATSTLAITASKPTRTHQISVGAFHGTAEVDGGKLEGGRVAFEVDMKSIKADDDKLTGHLQSQDFFWTEKYPTATFTSTEIKAGGDKGATHTVTGNLEMRGVKKSITFPAIAQLTPEALALTSEFVINRKDWAIVYPGMADDLIRDEVVIKLDLKAPVAN